MVKNKTKIFIMRFDTLIMFQKVELRLTLRRSKNKSEIFNLKRMRGYI